jgi:hypothetical protein
MNSDANAFLTFCVLIGIKDTNSVQFCIYAGLNSEPNKAGIQTHVFLTYADITRNRQAGTPVPLKILPFDANTRTI